MLLLIMALGGAIVAMIGFLTDDSRLFYGGGICGCSWVGWPDHKPGAWYWLIPRCFCFSKKTLTGHLREYN